MLRDTCKGGWLHFGIDAGLLEECGLMAVLFGLQVWTFIVSEAVFRQTHPPLSGKDIVVDKVKIVAVDTRLVNPEPNKAT